jgi:hypothetical protein
MMLYQPLLSLSAGNDREAFLDPPQQAAEVATVGGALDGVSTELLYPEIVTDADLRSIPDRGDRCLFGYTRVGFPVFLFSADTGVITLNGKFVRLPASDAGLYSDWRVKVTHSGLGDGQQDGQFPPDSCCASGTPPTSSASMASSECS